MSTRAWFGIGAVFAGLLVTAAPAEAVPLSDELPISEFDNEQYSPAIAYAATRHEYLVVWENLWPGGGHDVSARRVRENGTLLGSFSITIGGNKSVEPAVAYDPLRDRYLVVWGQDYYGNGSDWDVYGAFVPRSGPPSGLPASFPITSRTTNQFHPEVVYSSGADEYLVVWADASTSATREIRARRVEADGSGFPAADFSVSSGAYDRDFPALAYNAARNQYLVTWDQTSASTGVDVRAQILAADGTPQKEFGIAIATEAEHEERPAAAACSAADAYLVAFQRQYPATKYDLYARFVSGDGTPGAAPLIDSTTGDQINAAVACDPAGLGFLVAWQDEYAGGRTGVWAREVAANGAMNDAFGLIGPGSESDREFPAVAGGAESILVAWEHEREGTSFQDVHGRLVWPAPEPGGAAFAAFAGLAALARRRARSDASTRRRG